MQTISVNTLISSPDANGGSDAGATRLIGNGTTHIALVSGWASPGDDAGEVLNANGDLGGWGVGTGGDDNIDPGQLLRVDFGSFDNFGVGAYTNAGTFNGIPVLSATFSLDDDNDSGDTDFSYTIHFTDNSTESGDIEVDGDEDHTLAGTGLNAGKLIAYIEFGISGGNDDQGQVDLVSVTTPVAAWNDSERRYQFVDLHVGWRAEPRPE